MVFFFILFNFTLQQITYIYILPSSCDVLLHRHPQAVNDMQKRKIKDLAKRLEEAMLKAASSKVFS